MKHHIIIDIHQRVFDSIWKHLLPKDFCVEEAAFMFVNREKRNVNEIFRYIDWIPVLPENFRYRSRFHFELNDEMRSRVIKHAHDHNTSIIEFHSHTGNWPAEFSYSDLLGFNEFVPHVWWRLKGCPYLAVVVTLSGFDGFAWISNPKIPERLDAITVNKKILKSTKLSQLRIDDNGKNNGRSIRS